MGRRTRRRGVRGQHGPRRGLEFLITADALAELLNPELDAIDPETALEIFVEFESDVHRIAQREFLKRIGGEPPILLTSADLDG